MILSGNRSSFLPRLAVAIAVVALAWAVRVALLPWLGTRLLYITFFPAVTVAAVVGGIWIGVVALVLSALLALTWLGSPLELWATDPVEFLGIFIFLSNGLIIVLVSGALHRAWRRTSVAMEREERAAAASLVSEQRFRSMADAAPVMIWLSGASRAFTWFNRPWLEFVGGTMDEELGDKWLRHVHPDDLDRCRRAYGEAFDARREFRMDYRLRHQSGEFRWVLDHGLPLFGPEGEFVGFVGSRVDVTDMKNAEEARAQSEQRLRLGLRAGATGTWDWDVAANRVTWSDQIYEFHGIEPGGFGGTLEAFAELVHPGDRPGLEQAIREAMEKGREFRQEFRAVRPDGEVRWLSTTGGVMYGERGQPIRMMGATIDITQRKQAEQEREQLLASERSARSEAEHASRMKDEFLATLSHELRTPLNAILGWAHLLRRGRTQESLSRPEDLEQGLSIIERNARVQTQLIEDLLDMSRIVSGKLRLDVRQVDLPAVIESALGSVRPSAQAKQIRIQEVIDPKATGVRGDPARLQQVVWNLLTNAIKFTPRGGRVHVSLARVNSHVEITVSDTGAGIDPGFLPHLFERFRQADATTTRAHGGLGLGLAIVKHLVELHGGTVQASSEGLGKGATFRISLPVPAAAEPAVAGAHPATSEQQDLDEHRIGLADVAVLVVDDEPDARDLIRRVLEDRGATVEAAGSAKAALDMIHDRNFDLLVSDIGMPEMDGYALVSELRHSSRPQDRQLPAVALTAFARSEDRRRAMMAGFDMFVTKPVEPVELVAVIARLSRKA